MKKDLVVITGGTSDLGLELAKLFSKTKINVLSLSRSRKIELKNVFYEYGNLSDENFIKSVYKKYEKDFSIKYLINNAASGFFC